MLTKIGLASAAESASQIPYSWGQAMITRFATLALVAIIGGIIVFAPVPHPARAQSIASPGLALANVSGTLARGGQFTGDVTITRLTNRAGQLVVDGTLTGTTMPSGSQPALMGPTNAATSQPTSTSELTPVSAAAPTSQPTPATEPTSTSTTAPTVLPTSTAVPTSTAPSSDAGAFSAAALAVPSEQSTAVMQSFREIPLTIADPDGAACDTLSIDLGTVFLDQTGVQLDPAPTTLDLSTVPRANRPLGNLLCAVASLVEVSPGGSQAALLNELLPVVNRALSGTPR